jgi:hypothetical protein
MIVIQFSHSPFWWVELGLWMSAWVGNALPGSLCLESEQLVDNDTNWVDTHSSGLSVACNHCTWKYLTSLSHFSGEWGVVTTHSLSILTHFTLDTTYWSLSLHYPSLHSFPSSTLFHHNAHSLNSFVSSYSTHPPSTLPLTFTFILTHPHIHIRRQEQVTIGIQYRICSSPTTFVWCSDNWWYECEGC